MSVNPTNKVFFPPLRADEYASVLVIGFADILQRGNEIVQDFSRDHDTVAVRADFFRDAHHASACIALQVNKEGLAVSNDFFGANDIVVHCFYTRGGYRKPL